MSHLPGRYAAAVPESVIIPGGIETGPEDDRCDRSWPVRDHPWRD
ncbi:hypothetical protein FDG2_2581 [Candidatus Protofrankia californiensis]|uniref:Uncharacterized protein n=1 Tax=Candidatus Protofrankia californiensis TaxID=1839754 RepID=A0A1C3NXX9_9ACTN|nr:hypothetical protein FDG2_2581 [Candidatus Protofrankia californiensis]